MKPIEFKGQTVVLQKPEGMTDEQCGSLAILRLDNTCISCWRMNWRERIKAMFTGKVWLGVLSGHTQPPVYVAIDRPFTMEQANGVRLAHEAKENLTKILLQKYGEEAATKARRLNDARIPQSDLRRNFYIEEPDFVLAQAYGIVFLFGLKLCKK